MTICTQGGKGAGERDDAADADAGFFVRALGRDAEKVLEEGKFGFIGRGDEDVVVGFVELGGDGELAFGNAGVGEQSLEFFCAHGGELDVTGVEFAEHLLERFVVALCESREFVIGGDVADFLRAICVVLIFDGHIPALATRHQHEPVAFRDAAGERGPDRRAPVAVAAHDDLVSVELLRRMELRILRAVLFTPQLQLARRNNFIVQAVHWNARCNCTRLRRFMGSSFFGHA